MPLKCEVYQFLFYKKDKPINKTTKQGHLGSEQNTQLHMMEVYKNVWIQDI